MATLAMRIMADISRKTAAENKAGSQQWGGLFHWHKLERQNQRASVVQAFAEWGDLVTQAQKDAHLGWMQTGDAFMAEAQAKQTEAEAKTAEGDTLVTQGQDAYGTGAYQSAAQTWENAALRFAEASLAYANGIEKCNEAHRCYKSAMYAIVPPDPTPPQPQ